MIPATSPLIPPSKPFLTRFACSRDMPPNTPLAPLRYIPPPPAFLLNPPLLHRQSQNCPFQGFFGSWYARIWVQNGSTRSSKMAKKALLGDIWVPRMSIDGSICIGTNRNDAQTRLIPV